MSQLELDSREKETLVEVVRSFLAELRNEVGHTDRLEYRERLKDQEELIHRILVKLEGM